MRRERFCQPIVDGGQLVAVLRDRRKLGDQLFQNGRGFAAFTEPLVTVGEMLAVFGDETQPEGRLQATSLRGGRDVQVGLGPVRVGE